MSYDTYTTKELISIKEIPGAELLRIYCESLPELAFWFRTISGEILFWNSDEEKVEDTDFTTDILGFDLDAEFWTIENTDDMPENDIAWLRSLYNQTF